MEDGLRVTSSEWVRRLCTKSLNPCFNGRWSARKIFLINQSKLESVLILVLMEDGLRGVGKSVLIDIVRES